MALNAPVSVAITSEGQATPDLSGAIDTLGDAHNYGDIHSAAGSAAHDLANATTSITGDLTFNPEYNEVDKQVATDLANVAATTGMTVGEVATASKAAGLSVSEYGDLSKSFTKDEIDVFSEEAMAEGMAPGTTAEDIATADVDGEESYDDDIDTGET